MLADVLSKCLKKARLSLSERLDVISELMKASKVVGFREKLTVAVTVARLQYAMLQRRVSLRIRGLREQLADGCGNFYRKLEGELQAQVYGVKSRYADAKNVWRTNQHFTLWLIPADGKKIAKTHVKRNHLKYAVTGFAAVFVVMLATIGVLANFAIQNEAQKQEILEYKQSKIAQEQTIKELRQMTEKNQQQLAYLSKLEDKVRAEMQKSGADLPPKSDITAYAGKGGANVGGANSVSIILEQEKNVQREANARKTNLESLLNIIENENYRREVTPSHWPTSGGEITSYWGGRTNPFDGYSSDWHPGIDIGNDYGAPVYAAAAGYVAQSGWYGGYGRYIRLTHDLGYVTAYGHMSSLAVSAGQYVKKGDVIGYVGSSGYSTGPHLHFEVHQNGVELNPLKLVG